MMFLLVIAKLIRENKIKKSDEPFKNLLSKAMREKSGADYGKSSFSYEDAKWFVQHSEEFVNSVRNYL